MIANVLIESELGNDKSARVVGSQPGCCCNSAKCHRACQHSEVGGEAIIAF
jgi:hypothetical protein